MTDLALKWIPRFDYGDASLQLTYPVTRWTPGARTEGRVLTAGLGAIGPFLRTRKYLLGFSLRFTEAEWQDVIPFISFAQMGASFLWFPNGQDVLAAPESITVWLEAPHISAPVRPIRDGSLIWLLSLPITLSKMDSPWNFEYFQPHTVDV